ncbi:type II secretion system protein J [Thermodesulfobacteriota bacterium]
MKGSINISKNDFALKKEDGFTLIEVLLSVVFLGLLAVSVSAVYSSGNQSMDYQAGQLLLDSKVRSRMEFLISTDFNALSGSTEVVTIKGNDYTITWTVANVDLNSDGITELTAKQITVSVSGLSDRSLTTIVVDNEKKIGKIS